MSIQTTYDYTGVQSTFTVPSWVNKITIELWGAGGAGFYNPTAGNNQIPVADRQGLGGYVKADVTVTPGEALIVFPGGVGGGSGAGQGGSSGYAGGGMSYLARGGTRLVIAGGGGGGGAGGLGDKGGAGGHGGQTGTAGTNGIDQGFGVGGSGGGGGSQSSGGSQGSGGTVNLTPGASLQGGHGGNGASGGGPGGGGGGGLFGGGGGGGGTATGRFGGGGGGGSSIATGAIANTVTYVTGNRRGAGRITISYAEQAPNAPTNVGPGAGAVLDTDTPVLSAYFTTNYVNSQPVQAKAKLEWTLATDPTFTQNVRTIIQPDTAFQYGSASAPGIYVAYQMLASEALFQGTWYLRARAIDTNGQASAFSGSTSFVIHHPPTTLNHQPTGDTSVQYQPGGVLLTWSFSGGGLQSAYQVLVESVTGSLLYDSGKVLSQNSYANVIIAAAQKGQSLRWRVQVWDSDNVQGTYSTNQLFRVADLPTVVIDPIDVLNNPNPVISWTATPANAVPILQKRVFITRDSDGLVTFDSGWVS